MNMDKKYRVAVCLSGLFRNWDLCRASFRYWEKVHKNISFEYFISTWDETQYLNQDKKSKEVKKEIALVTPNHFVDDFDNGQLKSFKLINENDEVELNKNNFRNIREVGVNIHWNTKKYAFLLMNVNLLKSKYELENNFIYDAVINTRPDVLIKAEVLFTLKKYFLNDNIFNHDTLEIFLDKQIRACDDRNLAYVYSAGDVFSFGMSSTMDIYTGMYRYAYMSKNYNMITAGTSINPFHMRHTGLWELRIPRADGIKVCLPVVPRLSLRPYKQQLNDGEWVNTRWEEITKYAWGSNRIENKHENWHP